MGTNYYLIKNYCDCCKRFDKIHLGKNSHKLPFHLDYSAFEFHVNWKWELFKNNTNIVNEYNTQLSIDNFIKIVDSKKKIKQKFRDKKYVSIINNYIFISGSWS